MIKDNPWIGLSSYQEFSDKPFCGRDKAIAEVSSLVLENLFLTLYGSTGIGKTSLLQAGIFPYLRNHQYLPITIRLGQLPNDKNLAESIVCEVRNAVGEDNLTTSFNETDATNESYLWSFFASTRFKGKDGNIIYPVLVFDQFEEVFIQRKRDAWQLMRQLYALLDDSLIADANKGQHSDTNFRIIISIREDDLFRLEECIDSLHLSEMLYCRYRLTQMTDDEARAVVMIPGENIVSPTDKEELANQIIKLVKRVDEENLSTLLLSLICDLLYHEAERNGCDYISLQHLLSLGENPLKGFYQTVSKSLSRKQRMFIEDKMLDFNGRRNSVSITDFEQVFGKSSSFLEGKNKIFNSVSVSSKTAVRRIELIHDLLAQTVFETKTARNERKNFVQKILTNGIFEGLVLAFSFFAIFFGIITQSILVKILWGTIGLLLIFFIFMGNIAKSHNDKKAVVFILPQISISLLFYLSLQKITIYAYHTIKPSIITMLYDIFISLNLISVVLSILICFSKHNENSHLKWADFFSLKRSENRIVYFSLLFGLICSLSMILFTPDTHPERLRKLAAQGDGNAMVELGNYYLLKYDCDKMKAKEWFEKAKLTGIEIDDDIDYTLPMITDTMKIEAINAILAKNGVKSLETIKDIIDTNKYYDDSIRYHIYEILEYYKGKNTEAYMRWLAYAASTININYFYTSLGLELWRGEYVEQDMERAFELYVKGNSHRNVTVCYLNGWGVERNPKKALEYAKEKYGGTLPLDIEILLIWANIFN